MKDPERSRKLANRRRRVITLCSTACVHECRELSRAPNFRPRHTANFCFLSRSPFKDLRATRQSSTTNSKLHSMSLIAYPYYPHGIEPSELDMPGQNIALWLNVELCPSLGGPGRGVKSIPIYAQELRSPSAFQVSIYATRESVVC